MNELDRKPQHIKQRHTSVVKEEFWKWLLSCLILAMALGFTGYVYKTDELPFYGSLYEREYAQMEEEYADYTAEKVAEQEEIRLANQRQQEYEAERDKNGNNEIDLKAILYENPEHTEIKVFTSSDAVTAEISQGETVRTITLDTDKMKELKDFLENLSQNVTVNQLNDEEIKITIN